MAIKVLGWLATLLVVTLTGCAHPVSLSSDVSKLMGSGANKIDRKVGLVMTDEQRRFEQTTPSGGGDKVSYLPYRDLESGLYVVLSENFAGVTRVAGVNDPKVAADGLAFLVLPAIATTSFSPSLVTWPPTIFTVAVTLSVVDPRNNPVTEVKVQGEGRAEFDDFKTDVSLSAKRAAEDVLKKLMKAINDISAQLR